MRAPAQRVVSGRELVGRHGPFEVRALVGGARDITTTNATSTAFSRAPASSASLPAPLGPPTRKILGRGMRGGANAAAPQASASASSTRVVVPIACVSGSARERASQVFVLTRCSKAKYHVKGATTDYLSPCPIPRRYCARTSVCLLSLLLESSVDAAAAHGASWGNRSNFRACKRCAEPLSVHDQRATTAPRTSARAKLLCHCGCTRCTPSIKENAARAPLRGRLHLLRRRERRDPGRARGGAGRARACVVDTFADPAYARSSVKIVGPKDDLLEATLAAARDAFERVDLREEPAPAPHPRQGAVDMVSFMPLTEKRDDDLLEACDALAWRFGEAFDGVPILMYGPRAGRSLVEARRGTSFFASTKDAGPPSINLAPDFGPADVTAEKGAAVVGAQPYVTNYNVAIDGSSGRAVRRRRRCARASASRSWRCRTRKVWSRWGATSRPAAPATARPSATSGRASRRACRRPAACGRRTSSASRQTTRLRAQSTLFLAMFRSGRRFRGSTRRAGAA